jgi:tetratricopeptide (TPR) repeat protein
MLARLQEIVERTDATLAVSATTISDAVRELNELEGEESAVSHQLTSLRRRLTEMGRIQESAANYREALRIQRDRLQISDWLGQHRTGEEDCPVCGGHLEPSEEKLAELRSSLKSLELEAGDTFEIPAAFDREMQRVQTEVNESTERLKAIQIRKKALSQRSQEANTQQYQAKRVERFIGNLENALKLHERLGEDAGLRTEVDELRIRLTQLQSELSSENIDARKRRALRLVNNNAARLVSHLDTERPNDPVSLEVSDLTVKVTGSNRDDYLSEIGSGSNWLSYHVAMVLALQQFFLTLDHSPVPGFVVMDQPIQVYFPKKLVVREQEEVEEPRLEDEDIEAVHKAYQVMSDVVSAANGGLQIIVLDHAPREVWGDIPNVVAFEEWRGGVKLVPSEWLS